MAETQGIVNQLSLALHGERAAPTFACGGKLTSEPGEGNLYAPNQTDVFMLYEDRDGQAHRINFPASAHDLESLSSNCEPATFGLLGEEKLDLEYRSAWKLDKTKFLTSFHPADFDIMEIIRQLLVPTATNISAQAAIVTDLYKLNVTPLVTFLTIDLQRAA
jgi:hypothetical protein